MGSVCDEKPSLFPVEVRATVDSACLTGALNCCQEAIKNARGVISKLPRCPAVIVVEAYLMLCQAVDEYDPKVRDLFQEAADLGFSTGCSILGTLFDSGIELQASAAHVMELLRRAADRGHVHAHYLLGKLLYQGKGVPADKVEAESHLKIAAEQGCDMAQIKLAAVYVEKKPPQKEEAKQLFACAIAQGNIEAQVRLAEYYQNFEKAEHMVDALQLYRSAATLGHSDAFFWLGIQHYSGKCVQRDKREACRCLRHAKFSDSPRLQEYGSFAYVLPGSMPKL